MEEKVRIDKINIQIGDTTVALDLDNARELQKLLNDLFGVKEGETIYIPSPYPVYPYVYREPCYRPYGNWGVSATWGGTDVSDNTSSCITYTLGDGQISTLT